MSSAGTLTADDWAAQLFTGRSAVSASCDPAEEVASARADEDDGIARFRQINHFETLLRAAIEAGGVTTPDDPLILVQGAGTGVHGVAPCLRLFRGARIVASDRTDKDFAALRRHLRQSGANERVVCLAMEPEDEVAPAESFDLIAGAFILHRLVDPDRAMANAFRMLKPGGHAIFMEPFDGHGLIRLAFERICAEADLRAEPLAPGLRDALVSSAIEIAGRTMPDSTRPGFAEMDQKWLFSRESLAAGARQAGFRQAVFLSHNDHWTLYRDFADVMLREKTGASVVDLPEWAWDVLAGFDRALPPPVKRLLMLEGTMVLSK
jgi:SAM-dependent methyltransferase